MSRLRELLTSVWSYAKENPMYYLWLIVSWFTLCSFIGMLRGNQTCAIFVMSMAQLMTNFMLYICQRLCRQSHPVWTFTELGIGTFYTVATVIYVCITFG